MTTKDVRGANVGVLMDVRTKGDVESGDPYDYEVDLNVRDDDPQADPAYNEFYKGWGMDPYQFQQWAKSKGNGLDRRGSREVIPLHCYPEYFADVILTLWNEAKGTLQDFYEGYTLQFNNNLKTAIADRLKAMGWTVYPVLTDDRAYYAALGERLVKKARGKSALAVVSACAKATKSEALGLCVGEAMDAKESGSPLSDDAFKDLVGYYAQVFPQDYAVALAVDLTDYRRGDLPLVRELQDYDFTDESLYELERMLSGDRDPYYPVHDGGQGLGWDYVADFRGFDGTRPEQYEITGEPGRYASVKKN